MDVRQIGGFKYSASATGRIRQMEADAIAKFFDEISLQAATRAVSILPNLSGFRPNSAKGVHQRIQFLAKRLVGDTPQRPKDIERDFNVLGFAWMSWGIEHLGDANIISDYIDRNQARDRAEISNKNSADDDPLAVELFEKLRDLSRTNRCARADIKRFFEFSPFVETERVRSIIESCKPAADVAHDKKVSALPAAVARAEHHIAELSKFVGAIAKDNKTHTEKFSALRKDVDALRSATADNGEIASEIRERLDAALVEMATQKRQAIQEAKAREKLFQAVATSIEKLQSELAAITDRIDPLIESSVKAGEELDQMRQSMIEIRAIVDRLSNRAGPIDAEPNGTGTRIGAACSVALGKLRGSGRGDPVSLRVGAEFVSAVTANLETLKIQKSSAEALALEGVAGLMAGQMPYFAGLNGKRVAEACALALAAKDTHVLTVPVGLSAPNEFRRRLESLFAMERQNVGCVIIEGINRSALDAFGESLLETISRQRSGDQASRSLLLMATLTDGPASLPLSVAHVSLGPIFHTDALDWRSRPRTEAQRAEGRISAQIWETACSAAERATPDSEEALRLLDEFAPIANPLLRGSILSGFRYLSALRSEETGPTVLQSLAFGWLVPVCIAVGATAEAIDQEFDQGIVDGTVSDKRIANLLRSGLIDRAQREGVR